MSQVQTTIYVSLMAQVAATLYSFLGLNVPLYNENHVLTEILGLETIVQLIELTFYFTFGFILPTMSSMVDIAAYRYADWFITTPTMILSTIAFMKYVAIKEHNNTKKKQITSLKTFTTNNTEIIITIMVANAFMLLMGLLKELDILSLTTSQTFGFAGFGAVFYLLYDRFAKHSYIGKNLWYYMVSTWGMYGVAAMFPNITKNTMYNLLDIVSKNFYSVFLTTYILGLQK